MRGVGASRAGAIPQREVHAGARIAHEKEQWAIALTRGHRQVPFGGGFAFVARDAAAFEPRAPRQSLDRPAAVGTRRIDAGDAGIRVSGNINLAAVTVVNAGNISAGGSSTGAPAAVAAAPAVSTVTNAASAAAATTAASQTAQQQQKPAEQQTAEETAPSLFSVEVIGYGEGPAEDEEDEDSATTGG